MRICRLPNRSPGLSNAPTTWADGSSEWRSAEMAVNQESGVIRAGRAVHQKSRSDGVVSIRPGVGSAMVDLMDIVGIVDPVLVR